MSKTNIEKVKYFDPKGLRRLAEQHKTKFIRRVTEEGKDYKGAGFKEYSESYKKLIASGFSKKDGGRLKAYKGFPVGGKTVSPKFALRGLTMAQFKVRKVSTDHWVVGWSGEGAAIVQGNKKKGRNIVDDFPANEWNYIMKGLGKLVDREWKKIPDLVTIKA